MRAKPLRWLLLAGVIVTVASSTLIEVCLVLFFTPVSAAPLRALVLVGIGGVVIGSGIMCLASRTVGKRIQP
jgi:hypothetical protein